MSTSDDSKNKVLPLPIKLITGAVAGVVGTSCIFPIDMVKTRLQGSNIYKGPIHCFKTIYANEGGLKGFYKGLAPNLTGVMPEKAIKLVGLAIHGCLLVSC